MKPESSLLAVISARHLPISWAISIQSMPSYAISWRPILILFPIYAWVFQVVLSLRFPQQNPVYTSVLPIRATCPAHLIFLDLITQQYWVRSTDHSAPHYVIFSSPRYLVPFRPKYSPQHPVLKHPCPMFLPLCERPCFTPIQNNRQNYSSVHLNLYIFR